MSAPRIPAIDPISTLASPSEDYQHHSGTANIQPRRLISNEFADCVSAQQYDGNRMITPCKFPPDRQHHHDIAEPRSNSRVPEQEVIDSNISSSVTACVSATPSADQHWRTKVN